MHAFFVTLKWTSPYSNAWDKPTIISIRHTIFRPWPFLFRIMTEAQSFITFVHRLLPSTWIVGSISVECSVEFLSDNMMAVNSLSVSTSRRGFTSSMTNTIYRMPRKLMSIQRESSSGIKNFASLRDLWVWDCLCTSYWHNPMSEIKSQKMVAYKSLWSDTVGT